MWGCVYSLYIVTAAPYSKKTQQVKLVWKMTTNNDAQNVLTTDLTIVQCFDRESQVNQSRTEG